MLLPSVVAFFLARRPASQRQSDPERGSGISAAHVHQNDLMGDDCLPMSNIPVQNNSHNNHRQHENLSDEDGNDHMDIDNEQDENVIIQELEREEYSVEESTRLPNRPHGSFSSFSTLVTGTVPSCLSRFWSKLKAFMNTKTSLEDLESYVPQYRYLPILSGVIIPFSILLEIPGLTDDWYIRTVDHKVVESKSNTLILDTGLAFSLACSVIANICLVLRFLEKNIKLMTVLCVIFLTTHGMYSYAYARYPQRRYHPTH